MRYNHIWEQGMGGQLTKGLLVMVIIMGVFLFAGNYVFAKSGEIDSAYKYAWGENIGWINFKCDNCNVEVSENGISGYAWSSNYGWINLDPAEGGINISEDGNLTGFAWSSNLGWIDFAGVSINEEGEFVGYATLTSDSSKVSFNCENNLSCASSDFKLKTEWIPPMFRPRGTSGSVPRPKPTAPAEEPSIPDLAPPPWQDIFPPFSQIKDQLSEAFNSTSAFLSYLFGGPKPLPDVKIVQIPKLAPFALQGNWNLLPEKNINTFVFAPLPREIRMLAGKFPELDRTLREVGVERFSDMGKLTGVSLNIPGLTDVLNTTIKKVGLKDIEDMEKIGEVTLGLPGISDMGGKLPSSVGTGKITLLEGLPVAKFSLAAKNNLPAEFVFARASDELIDLKVDLAVKEDGEITQNISALPGKTMKLVVKPISAARDVSGYIVFKSATPKVTKNSILRSSLSASALFSMEGLVENISDPMPVEKKLVLSSFSYEDPDKDGIYTADVTMPSVPGEYEIITVIAYVDPDLGTRKMSMVTVIDPEGYVFEKNNGKETRIPSAIVTLYSLNTSTKEYEIWKASDYSQENPQITDVRGTYSFLVPAGTYYFHVEAPGYEPHNGKAFVVAEGNGVHQNIELKSESGWLPEVDLQTALLVVVCLLLVYNLYRNKRSGIS